MRKIFGLFLLILLACVVFGCAGKGESIRREVMVESLPHDRSTPKFSTPVSTEEVRVAFYHYSAPAIVRGLRENEEANWNFVLDQVQAGDKDWIYTLINYMAPGTDAGTATDTLVSLAYALPNNPEYLLTLAQSPSGPALFWTCGLPFIEPEYDFIVRHGQKSLAALHKIDDSALLDSRDFCVRRLQDALDRCEKIYLEGKWDW